MTAQDVHAIILHANYLGLVHGLSMDCPFWHNACTVCASMHMDKSNVWKLEQMTITRPQFSMQCFVTICSLPFTACVKGINHFAARGMACSC